MAIIILQAWGVLVLWAIGAFLAEIGQIIQEKAKR